MKDDLKMMGQMLLWVGAMSLAIFIFVGAIILTFKVWSF